MNGFDAALAAWRGSREAAIGIMPEWPTAGVAIEGDFSGIQRFVLRPVPGASGAASRLRARSFRVLALTRLAAALVSDRFSGSAARLFYSAGGRFLIVAQPCGDWPDRLASLQNELDDYLLNAHRGELVFHLAGAEFADDRIPVARLGDAMGRRKNMPLACALRNEHGWATERFSCPGVRGAKCEGCGFTAVLRDDSEGLCQTCVDDRELGRQLLAGGRVALARSPQGSVALLEERWTLASNGQIEIPFIVDAPRNGRQLADFDDLSKRAAGRAYLAYLRIDADRIGSEFRKLSGDPGRTWGLSRLLDEAFSSGISKLLRTKPSNLYPVYGGGDDLFLIGPWNEALDFAAALRSDFRVRTDDQLTFSAGVALAKPRQHILTKSEEAAHALDDEAKTARDSIHALGDTIPWEEFDEVYAGAQQLARLHAARQVKSSFLHDLAYLHALAHPLDPKKKANERWHSRLFYQVERNLNGDAKDFARRAFLSPGRLWRHAGFIVRYAMLHSGGAALDSATEEER